MPGALDLATDFNLAQEGFGPKVFTVVNDFEFGFVEMFSIGSEKTDKTFGAGFQNWKICPIFLIKTHFGRGGIFKPQETDVVIQGFSGKTGYLSCREEVLVFAQSYWFCWFFFDGIERWNNAEQCEAEKENY